MYRLHITFDTSKLGKNNNNSIAGANKKYGDYFLLFRASYTTKRFSELFSRSLLPIFSHDKVPPPSSLLLPLIVPPTQLAMGDFIHPDGETLVCICVLNLNLLGIVVTAPIILR